MNPNIKMPKDYDDLNNFLKELETRETYLDKQRSKNTKKSDLELAPEEKFEKLLASSP